MASAPSGNFQEGQFARKKNASKASETLKRLPRTIAEEGDRPVAQEVSPPPVPSPACDTRDMDTESEPPSYHSDTPSIRSFCPDGHSSTVSSARCSPQRAPRKRKGVDRKLKDSESEKKEQEIDDASQNDDEGVMPEWAWNIFRTTSRDNQNNRKRSCQSLYKVVRALMFLVLFLIVLLGTISHKISLLILTSTLATASPRKDEPDAVENQERNICITLLVIAMCTPYVLSFLAHALKSLFGSQPWPTPREFLMILGVESVSTVGLCLLVLRILPSLDMIRALFVMSATCSLPALIKLLFSRPYRSGAEAASSAKRVCYKMIWYIATFIAASIQVSSIALLVIGGFQFHKFKDRKPETTMTVVEHNASLVYVTTNVKHRSRPAKLAFADRPWDIIIGLLCVMALFWENFVERNPVLNLCGRKVVVPLVDAKRRCQELRQKSALLTSLWKCFIIAVIPLSEFDSFRYQLYRNYEYQSFTRNVFYYQLPVLVMIISALVVHYFAGLACKLKMQHFSFSLPLTLATPVTLALILTQCNWRVFPTFHYPWLCPERDILDSGNIFGYFHLGSGVLWWLSQLIVVAYIWKPRQNRMEKREKLFVHPFYDGILLEQWFMLNRRRRSDDVHVAPSPDLSQSGDLGESFTSSEDGASTTPKIYACATMWHETSFEMTQLLKSIFRMDIDQCTRRVAVEALGIKDADYYEFEAHILFDDAMELNENHDHVPNGFVKRLVGVVDRAASEVHRECVKLSDPERTSTPYGGRLTWHLPGGTDLVVHLKDVLKVRQKKRWSQCMYMYYLLGYKIVGECWEKIAATCDLSMQSRESKSSSKKGSIIFSKGEVFDSLPPHIAKQAENTFILALDGDVNFTPDAVHLLLHRMMKNPKVGASCGRVHPVGSGPVVWYQKFEYAFGHWLQKAAEHVFGCTLCTPGCFSLYRGSALMDDNVMSQYVQRSERPIHFIRYDQGEDRWMCTLLLQQGYRVDYCAASDAKTLCPDSFNELFNQRRRWISSSLANLVDFLSSFRHTSGINDNVSYLYILYQFILLVSSLLGPATVIIVIAGAFYDMFGAGIWSSYAIALTPTAFYTLVCFRTKQSTQLRVAAYLSAGYAILMVVVFVAAIKTAVVVSLTRPTVVFLSGLVVITLVGCLLHPQEAVAAIHGPLYFLLIPCGHMLILLYCLSNMHQVCWGTREIAHRRSEQELEQERLRERRRRRKEEESAGILGWLGVGSLIREVREYYKRTSHQNEVLDVLRDIKAELRGEKSEEQIHSQLKDLLTNNVNVGTAPEYAEVPNCRIKTKEDVDSAWLLEREMGSGRITRLGQRETAFWKQFLRIHLYPVKRDLDREERTSEDLMSMRNNVVFLVGMLNLIWMVLIIQLQRLQEDLTASFLDQFNEAERKQVHGSPYEPMGWIFLSLFGLVLLLQFIAMFIHCWSTFLQIICNTELNVPWKKAKNHKEQIDKALEFISNLQTVRKIPEVDDLPPGKQLAFEHVEERPMTRLYRPLNVFTRNEEKIKTTKGELDEMHHQHDHQSRQANRSHFPRTDQVLDETVFYRIPGRPAFRSLNKNCLEDNFFRRIDHLNFGERNEEDGKNQGEGRAMSKRRLTRIAVHGHPWNQFGGIRSRAYHSSLFA